jgi:PAS domain S-box-containing protein
MKGRLKTDKALARLQELQREYNDLKKTLRKTANDLKRAEEMLVKSDDMYRLIFENSGEAIIFTNPNGEIYAANPKACEIYNMSEEEICKTGRQGLLDMNDPRVYQGLKIRRETGVFRGEINQIRKGGIIFPTEVSSIVFRDSKGKKRTCTVIRDITEHKKIEKSLRESELNLRTILNNSPDTIYALDLISHTSKFLNKEEFCGYSIDELQGRNSLLDKIHPEDEPNVMANWHQLLNAKDHSVVSVEYRLMTKVGVWEWIHQRATVLSFTDDGKSKQILVTLSIITRQKELENDLRESEVRYRTLFENSQMGISLVSPDGKLLQANLAYARMYGYKDLDTLFSEIRDVTALYADPEARKEVIKILLQKGIMEPREIKVVRRDGMQFLALVAVKEIRDRRGNLLYNLATHIDLTERKKAEEKVRAASFYARNLIEASLDPLVTINVDGKITDVNHAAEKITGIKRKKLIGSDFTEYLAEPEKTKEEYQQFFLTGEVKNYPLTIRHIKGKETDVLFNATVYRNEEGEIEGVFAAARDITERRKMELKLLESQKNLEKLNQHLVEVREEERADISREIHDQLGQSLTALKLDLNMLKENKGSDPCIAEKLNAMLNIVSGIIKDVQRISADLRPSILDDLGLKATFEWYCDEFKKKSDIKCVLNVDNADYTDPLINLTLFRILQEALTNVIRHSGATLVDVMLHSIREGITLSIRDNGKGIKEEEIKIERSLGLAGIRERVKHCNGDLIITSGEGTTVTVFIPAEKYK